MQKQTLAYILTCCAVLFWGTAASAFKLALRSVSPYTLLVYASLVSTVALLVILVVQKKLATLRDIPRKSLAMAALLGFFNPFCYYTILFKAYDLLPGQIAMSLNYGWPLALTLLSVPILKQTLSKSQLIAIVVSFAGAIVIATKGRFTAFDEVSILGVGLAFASTVVWAVFWLLNARDHVDPAVKLFLGFCFGLFYAIIFSPLFGGIPLVTGIALVPLVYIGLFEMGITFVLWLTALQLSSSAARIGNLIYVSPFLSLVFLRIVIGETIHLATFVGLFMIVGSIVVQEVLAQKTRRERQGRGDGTPSPLA